MANALDAGGMGSLELKTVQCFVMLGGVKVFCGSYTYATIACGGGGHIYNE
jgi:hypothetical protein